MTCMECEATFSTSDERRAHQCPALTCTLCNIVCQSRATYQAHLIGRRHRNAAEGTHCHDCQEAFLSREDLRGHRCPSRTCMLCEMTCQSMASLETHLRGKRHRNRLRLAWLADQSTEMLDELYGRALLLIENSDPPIDMEACSPNQLRNFFKKNNIGHFCLSCWNEYAKDTDVAEHIECIQNEIRYAVTDKHSHIYPLSALKAERDRVEEAMGDDPVAALKIKVLFAIKAAMLVHVPGLRKNRRSY